MIRTARTPLTAWLLTLTLLGVAASLTSCDKGASVHDDTSQTPTGEGAEQGAGEAPESGASAQAFVTPDARHVGMRPEGVPEDAAEAVFAGGCFWCVEAVFEELDGVYEAVSGYAGGSAETANYKTVSYEETGHAEVVKIYYDPAVISYQTLLEVHFVTHDPTTLNRQGADVGTQYRSAIFYVSQEEMEAAQAYIDELEASGELSEPIVTTLEPLDAFYVAEDYHQNYVCENPLQGYVQGVALPKVEKVREKFEKLLKAESPITL